MNERRYEFGDEEGAIEWVCAKIPSDGRIKKDCVPKVGLSKIITADTIFLIMFQREAPGWYLHLLDNRDYQVKISAIISYKFEC